MLRRARSVNGSHIDMTVRDSPERCSRSFRRPPNPTGWDTGLLLTTFGKRELQFESRATPDPRGGEKSEGGQPSGLSRRATLCATARLEAAW